MEAGSPAGVPVISTLALITNDDGSSGSSIAYFIEPASNASDWFQMDRQTGTITLRKELVGQGESSRNVTFTIGANRTGSRNLAARASAVITVHGLPRK